LHSTRKEKKTVKERLLLLLLLLLLLFHISKLLPGLASTVYLGFGTVGTRGQIYELSKITHLFRNGNTSSTREQVILSEEPNIRITVILQERTRFVQRPSTGICS
jgi:hypothetical protein